MRFPLIPLCFDWKIKTSWTSWHQICAWNTTGSSSSLRTVMKLYRKIIYICIYNFSPVWFRSTRSIMRNLSLNTRISGQCSDGVGGSRHPAPALIFEYKQYSACSTSHLLIGKGDTFQHCTSARDSGARVGDLECVDGLSSPNSITLWKLWHRV